MSHVIHCLAVHEGNQQSVYFTEGSEESIINKNIETTLTAYSESNKMSLKARETL